MNPTKARSRSKGFTQYCLWDLIRRLMEGSNEVYLNKYKRVGQKTEDENGKVVADPSPTRYLTVIGINATKDQFNFSFRALKRIKIRENNELVDKKQYRNYVLVHNGVRNIDTLHVSVDVDTFDFLKTAGLMPEERAYLRSEIYKIDLRDIPISSKNWGKPDAMEIAEMMKQEKILLAKIKVLEPRVKSTRPAGAVNEDADIYYTNYVPASGSKKDISTVKCCEWRLMKYKVTDNFSEHIKNYSHEQAVHELKLAKKQLMSVRYVLRATIFTCEQASADPVNWGAAKKSRKGNKTEQVAVVNGATIKRVTWQKQLAA